VAREDRPYLEWVGSQPCAVCGRPSGPPHYPRHDVGMGQRAHDRRAIPLCHLHHEDAQQYRGVFREMGKEGMREWMDLQAMRLEALYARTHEGE